MIVFCKLRIWFLQKFNNFTNKKLDFFREIVCFICILLFANNFVCWKMQTIFVCEEFAKYSQEVWKLGMWAECEPLKNSQFHVYITLDIIIHKMVRNINHFKEVIFGVRFFWLKSMCKVYTYILADVFWTFHLLWNSFNLVMLVLCKYLKQWISRNWGIFQISSYRYLIKVISYYRGYCGFA